MAIATTESRDTVNYTLHHKKTRAYDGITKEYRFEDRLVEHEIDRKYFDKVTVDSSKAKTEALDLERYRIRRFKGKYNVHHNS